MVVFIIKWFVCFARHGLNRGGVLDGVQGRVGEFTVHLAGLGSYIRFFSIHILPTWVYGVS